jgi:hypothetical protein
MPGKRRLSMPPIEKVPQFLAYSFYPMSAFSIISEVK